MASWLANWLFSEMKPHTRKDMHLKQERNRFKISCGRQTNLVVQKQQKRPSNKSDGASSEENYM